MTTTPLDSMLGIMRAMLHGRLRQIAMAYRQNAHGLPSMTDIAIVMDALPGLLDEAERAGRRLDGDVAEYETGGER